MLYIVKEYAYIWAKLDVTVRCITSSSINGMNKILGCKSLPLSRVCSIEDRALRFFQIVIEEETSCNAFRLIFIECFGCVHVSMGVHRVLLISTIITPEMNN